MLLDIKIGVPNDTKRLQPKGCGRFDFYGLFDFCRLFENIRNIPFFRLNANMLHTPA